MFFFLALLLAVPGPVVPGSYAWPLAPPQITRRFEAPPEPWLAGHLRPGCRSGPAAAGTVVFAGTVAGRGVVSVAHAGGLRSTYEPVTASVAAGDVVAIGEPLGTLDAGHAGCPVSACLHWGVRRGAEYLDPLALLGLGRVRLLPMPGVE